MSSGTRVANRYVSALIETARDGKTLDKVEGDVQAFLAMLAESSDLQYLITSPIISRRAQIDSMAAIADKAGFQTHFKNFLMLLAQNQRLSHVENIMHAFRSRLSESRGEMTAKVQVAQDLDDKEREALANKLGQAFGRKIYLDLDVRPELIGGLIVTAGSLQIDDSIATKLNRLKARMQANTHHSHKHSPTEKEVG